MGSERLRECGVLILGIGPRHCCRVEWAQGLSGNMHEVNASSYRKPYQDFAS